MYHRKPSTYTRMLLRRIRLLSSTAVIGSVVILLPVLADASGVGGVRVATSTVSKIVGLLTGDLATAAFLLIIVLGGLAWWVTRSSRAGEILGRTVMGAVIIFGAVQISEFFSFQGAVI
ncbi:MAG: TrbC/VirB2 family protein [Bacteroidetes bacterium]|nr:TrbC/VirB2 family protein [Bacteroidota bacterium]